MNTSIDICKNHLCEITVTGKELDNNSYSQELSNEIGSFRYTDTVTINVLYKVNSDNEETLKGMQISQHLQKTENGEILLQDQSLSWKHQAKGAGTKQCVISSVRTVH